MSKKDNYAVEIKLSSTFVKRAVCKHCGKGPCRVFFVRNTTFYKNPKYVQEQFEFIRKNVKRMCTDFYLEGDPSFFENTSDFKFPLQFKGYNPKAHRTRGATNKNNVTECASCECGRTTWQFNYKSSQDRKEISMRQAPRNFPGIIF